MTQATYTNEAPTRDGEYWYIRVRTDCGDWVSKYFTSPEARNGWVGQTNAYYDDHGKVLIEDGQVAKFL